MDQWTVKWTYQCTPDDGRVMAETYVGWIEQKYENKKVHTFLNLSSPYPNTLHWLSYPALKYMGNGQIPVQQSNPVIYKNCYKGTEATDISSGQLFSEQWF
jgi:hypothetical protein